METVQDKLTQLLALAQSGEIVGVAVATVHKDGAVGSSWSLGTTTRGAVLGALATVQHHLLMAEKDAVT
jgi:hypothetical protein